MPSLKNAALCSLYTMIAAWLINVFGLIASYQAVTPYATPGIALLATLGIFALISCGLLIPLSLPFYFWKRWRNQVVLLILASLIYVCVSLTAMILSGWIEEKGIQDFTKRMKPWIQKIEEYRDSKGYYPDSLKGYIEGGIETGMSRFPLLEYKKRKEGEFFPFHSEWMFAVSDKKNIRDIFFYLPSGQYPPSAYGGKVERLEDWGRVRR